MFIERIVHMKKCIRWVKPKKQRTKRRRIHGGNERKEPLRHIVVSPKKGHRIVYVKIEFSLCPASVS